MNQPDQSAQYGQPPPAYGQPQPAPYAQQGGESCSSTLACYGQCHMEQTCMTGCDARATPPATTSARAVLSCFVRNNCNDEACATASCGREMQECNLPPPVAAQPVAAVPSPPPATNNALVGQWGNSGAGFYLGMSNGAVKRLYTFAANGTYVFHMEFWGGSYRNDDYYVVDENGTYAANGNQLTIIPARATGVVRGKRDIRSTNAVPLERVTYVFQFHYFDGIKENDLVLTPPAKTARDGEFASNGMFPNSYLLSAGYQPQWAF